METLHEPAASLTAELQALVAEAEEKEAKAAELKKQNRELIFAISSRKDIRRILILLRAGFLAVGIAIGEYLCFLLFR
ncbi:MAG: hypothetical protein IIY84_04640 [Eubacterium sp.]|nr:hypothetical protein [Eubacterium sp.]